MSDSGSTAPAAAWATSPSSSSREPLAVDQALAGPEPARHLVDPERAHARRRDGAVGAHAHRGDDAGQREVALAASELGGRDSRAARRGGDAHLDEQLVGLGGRGEEGDEELAGGHGALAAGPAQHDLGVKRHRHRRQLGRRVVVHEAAAERAALTDRRVPDPGQRRSHERAARRDVGRVEQPPLRRHRADADVAVVVADVVEVVDAAEVDQVPRAREAHVDHRHQALAAGEHLGLVGAGREELHRLVNAVWIDVLKTCRLHAFGPRSPARRRRANQRLSLVCFMSLSAVKNPPSGPVIQRRSIRFPTATKVSRLWQGRK